MGSKVKEPPRIFSVNWFRTDENGKFIWPGFGENMRVLKWMVDRVHGRANAHQTKFGWAPDREDLEWSGLDFSAAHYQQVTHLDGESWSQELISHGDLFEKLKSRLPKELTLQRELLQLSLAR